MAVNPFIQNFTAGWMLGKDISEGLKRRKKRKGLDLIANPPEAEKEGAAGPINYSDFDAVDKRLNELYADDAIDRKGLEVARKDLNAERHKEFVKTMGAFKTASEMGDDEQAANLLSMAYEYVPDHNSVIVRPVPNQQGQFIVVPMQSGGVETDEQAQKALADANNNKMVMGANQVFAMAKPIMKRADWMKAFGTTSKDDWDVELTKEKLKTQQAQQKQYAAKTASEKGKEQRAAQMQPFEMAESAARVKSNIASAKSREQYAENLKNPPPKAPKPPKVATYGDIEDYQNARYQAQLMGTLEDFDATVPPPVVGQPYGSPQGVQPAPQVAQQAPGLPAGTMRWDPATNQWIQ